MWFLHRKVLLTKDNLARRNWIGCKKCVFCDREESIEHLFFECNFSKMIWRVIQFTFNIKPPTTVSNMFSTWLDGIDKITKARIRIGMCAILWAIWNCRNDIVFNKQQIPNFLQVIYRGVHWIRTWAVLLPVPQQELMESGCTRLLAIVRAVYCKAGWRHDRRLQDA